MIEIKTQGVYEFIKKYGADPRFDHENVLSHEAVIKQAYNKGFMDGWNKSRQWIPCSERLPEKKTKVLVTWESRIKHVQMVIVAYLREDNIWEDTSGLCMNSSHITAWMPLPEPYKESED